MRAMILAAGLGTRMAPLSDDAPKPVLPLLGRPLIARMVDQLAELGIERVAINTHAHPEQLHAALEDSPIPVDFRHEAALRGSGGGIHSAIDVLGEAPFLVLNADMSVDFGPDELGELCARHETGRALATLVLRDDPRKGDFGTIGHTPGGEICRIRDWIDLSKPAAATSVRSAAPAPTPGAQARVVEAGNGLFIGIQILSPAIFSCMPKQATFQMMTDVYVPALRAGHTLCAVFQPSERRWWPIGTPLELLDANLDELRARVPADRSEVAPDAHVAGRLHPPVWIGPGARVAAGSELGPNAIVGADAVVPAGFAGRDVLFLDGAHPRAARDVRRAIAYGGELWRE